jgi:hypothetical protein
MWDGSAPHFPHGGDWPPQLSHGMAEATPKGRLGVAEPPPRAKKKK